MTEEIHSGGKETTNVMAKALGLKPGMHVLDVCSALGAPARHIVKDHGVQVTGLDFTDAYNEEANKRTKAAGLIGGGAALPGRVSNDLASFSATICR